MKKEPAVNLQKTLDKMAYIIIAVLTSIVVLVAGGFVFLLVDFACGIESTDNCLTPAHTLTISTLRIAIIVITLGWVYASIHLTKKAYMQQEPLTRLILRLWGPVLIVAVLLAVYDAVFV